MSGVKVAVRVRPFNSRELARDAESIITSEIVIQISIISEIVIQIIITSEIVIRMVIKMMIKIIIKSEIT